MLVIKGQPGKDVCDKQLGITRRDLLRVGGAGVLGLTLDTMLQLQGQGWDRPIRHCLSLQPW